MVHPPRLSRANPSFITPVLADPNSRGNYVTEAFCDGTNDILRTSWNRAIAGDLSMRVATSQHIFNPSGRDSWRLTFSLKTDSYFAANGLTTRSALMEVWITCLRAD